MGVASVHALAGALALLALASAPAHGAFLQAGWDAARTGASEDAGPATDDVALAVALPGSKADGSPPLLLDGGVYVLTADLGMPGLGAQGLFRVDLGTAEVREVATFEERPGSFASDGERFFVSTARRAMALPKDGGAALWEWTFPDLVAGEPDGSMGPVPSSACDEPAFRDGVVYLLCVDVGAMEYGVFAAALDAATGEPRWVWVKAARDELLPGQVPPPPGPVPAARASVASLPAGLSVVGPFVFAVTTDLLGAGGPLQAHIWALGAEDGEVRWALNSTLGAEDGQRFAGSGDANTTVSVSSAFPTGTPDVVYVRVDQQLLALNPTRRTVIWSADLGREDSQAGDSSSGFGLVGDALYATSYQSVYRFDTTTHQSAWRFTLPPDSGEAWATSPLLHAGGLLYGRTFGNPGNGTPFLTANTNTLYALDAERGSLVWRRAFQDPFEGFFGRHFEFGLGEGVLAVAGIDGSLTVLGRAGASLGPVARASTLYPAPGEPVRVDLSGTRPGAQGPANEFRADWGDGEATDWQASPVFTHAYAPAGDRLARFQARNAAGQTATEEVTFFVGRPAPAELTPLQQAFAAENQDTTFFVLGLAVTGAAAAASLTRLHRRQQRLQRELRALEATFARTRDDPGACEAALAERKARAAALLADGKLHEAQVVILERRAEELARGLRLGTLDERFDFLPYGMVKTLRGMLEDGRISAWEREHFLDALQRDALLSPAQKEQVKALIEGWFERDSGAAARGEQR